MGLVGPTVDDGSERVEVDQYSLISGIPGSRRCSPNTGAAPAPGRPPGMLVRRAYSWCWQADGGADGSWRGCSYQREEGRENEEIASNLHNVSDELSGWSGLLYM